jgi:hypothetical protein
MSEKVGLEQSLLLRTVEGYDTVLYTQNGSLPRLGWEGCL